MIVEVDHPRTQARKRSCIAEAGLRISANVKFMAVDFESETLDEGLRRNGISAAQETFFSWLGVTRYHTEVAIDETLRAMARFPAGSQAVITFSQPPIRDAENSKGVAARLAEYVESAGESFISCFEPEAFQPKLLAAGFNNVELLSPGEAQTRYLSREQLELPCPPNALASRLSFGRDAFSSAYTDQQVIVKDDPRAAISV